MFNLMTQFLSMKKLILIIAIPMLPSIIYGQKKDLKKVLYKLETGIMNGDLESLKKAANYLDDTSYVQEFLGYHNYPNTAKGIVIRFIEENCLFTEDELRIDSALSSSKFLKFLNEKNVVFDDLTGEFLIKPAKLRDVKYQIKELSAFDLERIDTSVITSPYPDWYYENQIDGFLFNEDPQALKWIASAWYKKRARFNRYYFNDEEFLDLMKKLTRIDLGVPDEHRKTTFLYKDDYYAVARLNYLIYWENHYEDYKWNRQKKYFENLKETAETKTKEEILFSLLNSENDSIAISAFSQLTELDTGRVRILADDYQRSGIEKNFNIPIFPFRFLKQMVLLTQYCRDNEVNYKPTGWVLDSLMKLKTELKYPDRYKLEDNMINKLTLDDITSVEYYGLIYEEEWDLTYSLGRILDKFYSKNLNELIDKQRHLVLFLKKAQLFDRLGIIGICNKYLKKFQNCNQETVLKVRNLLDLTKDEDIKVSVKELTNILSFQNKVDSTKKKTEKLKSYGVKGFYEKYKTAVKKCKDEFDCQSKLADVLGLINYEQLGDVMNLLKKDRIFSSDELVSILQGNFGIPASSLEEFLQLYYTKNQHDLYEFYFCKTGLRYIDEYGRFNYESIYDILKYDIVDAFVGGGGGRREEGIYPLIKLLEIKFKTTLGFSEKLCDSGYPNIVCGPTEMARAWMTFLEEKKLITFKKTDPVSISD